MNSSNIESPAPEIEPRPLGWWRQLMYVLANGFVLFFFSERLFWTVFGADATLSDLIMTWLAYSAVAYLFLGACWWLRVGDFAAVFLAGALFGWLLEGGIAPTLYGTEPSSPFPLSLIWTAVAWHATLSVWLGWYRLGSALREGRNREVVGLSLFFGVFWGMWGMFPWQETPPVQTTEDVFLFHAVSMTSLLGCAYCLANRLQRKRHFKPAPAGLLIAAAVWGVFWLQIAITIGWMVPVILCSLLLLVIIPLWRSRLSRITQLALAAHGLRTPWFSYLLLIILPAVATMTYVLGVNIGMTQFPVAYVMLWLSTGIGIVLLSSAFIKVCRRSVTPP
ncbi:MAG: hypothetical protein KDB01_18285 [Planctomycetaceae bacterium]|nr:hypothetical protein [Planctomycetaceae bacterium]